MRKRTIVILASGLIAWASCKHEPFQPAQQEVVDNYPEGVKQIIVGKCATAGCHNATSYQVSGGGLLLDSWEHLFDGGNNGAVIIPYSPENSSLMYFVNAHADLGPLPPDNMKMPLNGTPLTREEYFLLADWVKKGAPDKNGNIPFASNPDTRQKIYLAHQGCDYITVIDAEKHVIMRTIKVGLEFPIESAQSVRVAPDGGTAYVCYWGSQYIQKIDTRTDTVTGQINIGSSNADMLWFPANGESLLMTSRYHNALLRINPVSQLVMNNYGGGTFSSPHGIAGNGNNDTFYVTEPFGNMLHKIPANGGTITKISVDGNAPLASGSNKPGVTGIVMTPDNDKYFVTCQQSNEVRVMNATTDQLMQVIPVGKSPQHITVSKTQPYIFVTCTEDSASNTLYKGSVYIINYNTYEVVKKINDRFYMPYALTVDDRNGMLYVFSRNIDPNGPVPHHNSSVCEGRSGYYSVYNFNTLQPVNNKRYEVTIDPYSADTRFKQ